MRIMRLLHLLTHASLSASLRVPWLQSTAKVHKHSTLAQRGEGVNALYFLTEQCGVLAIVRSCDRVDVAALAAEVAAEARLANPAAVDRGV